MHEYALPLRESGFAPHRRLSGCKYASFGHLRKVSDNEPLMLCEMTTMPETVRGTGFIVSRKRLFRSAQRCFRTHETCFPTERERLFRVIFTSLRTCARVKIRFLYIYYNMSVSVSRFSFVKTFYRRLRIFMQFAERCRRCVGCVKGKDCGDGRWVLASVYWSSLCLTK